MLPGAPAFARHVPSARGAILAWLVVSASLVVAAWVRWPGAVQGGLVSHDVAGILVEAMILREGGLPYVDTVELKAPGTFYLAWWLGGEGAAAVDRLQLAGAVWAWCSAAFVAVLAWRWWGPHGAAVATALYVLHDAHLDSLDANYVTWAQLPVLVAVLAATWSEPDEGNAVAPARKAGDRGAVARRGGRRSWAWVVSGCACGCAALCKRQAGLVALALVPWALARGGVPAAARVLAGIVLAHGPIALHYASEGQLAALWRGYVANPWGIEYVRRGAAGGGGRLHALLEGLGATLHTVGLPLLLAAFVVARAAAAGAGAGTRARALVGVGLAWAAAMGLAAAVGLRFYKGYFLAVAPPLCVLAAAPWGVLGPQGPIAALGRSRADVRARIGALVGAAALLLPVVALGARAALATAVTASQRLAPHDSGARAIAAHLQPHLHADDRVWVWGWHLWGVYVYAHALPGATIYKSLGLLTPPNDDTWRRPASPLRFVDGPAARRLIAELEAEPPAWIVLGSTVPHREFAALRQLLNAQYVRDRSAPTIGRVEFWVRRDRRPGASIAPGP